MANTTHYPLDAFDPRSAYKSLPYALSRLLVLLRRYSLAEWKHFSSMQLAKDGHRLGFPSFDKQGNATQPRTGQALHVHPFERTDAQSVGGVGK